MKFLERNPQKPPEELEFERLDKEYYQKFGSQYVIQMFLTPAQWEEVNADVKRCIDTGKMQVLRPYAEGVDY